MTEENRDELPDDSFISTSDDKRDKDLAKIEKVELVEAMADAEAFLTVVDSTPRLFGYFNPVSKRNINPMPFNEINLAQIMDALVQDFPAQTSSSVNWELKFLYRDMPNSVLTVEASVFNPSSDDKFPSVATTEGKPTVHYNTFNKEVRPISNTIVDVSPKDELVGNILYKAILESARTIANHSAVVSTDEKELERQIMATFGGFVQPRHARLRYAPVILGKQGSGKSILANLVANSSGYAEYMSIAKLTGDFGARWNEACTLVVDEATIESEAQSNMLKNFMTAQTVDLEEKYKAVVAADIHMNFIFTTNRISDFKTYETENRRYFVLTANGALPNQLGDNHSCITPRVSVSRAEYLALCNVREYDFVDGNDCKGVKAFIESPASKVEDSKGGHTIVMSQLGDISTKPRQYKGVFIALARKLAKHWEVGEQLEQLANRELTAGQGELPANVPAQLKVTTEHGIIEAYLQDRLDGVERAENVVNEIYINLNLAFDNNIPTTVMDYFKSKFVWQGEKYTVVTNDKTQLLVKLDNDMRYSPAGVALTNEAKELHDSFTSMDDRKEEIRKAKAIQSDNDAQKDSIEVLKVYLADKFPDGSGIISYSDLSAFSKAFTQNKMRKLILECSTWLKRDNKTKSYVYAK